MLTTPMLSSRLVAVSKQVIVHLDEDLHEAVRKWATSEDRSMSAQVRRVLREQVPARFFEAEPPLCNP